MVGVWERLKTGVYSRGAKGERGGENVGVEVKEGQRGGGWGGAGTGVPRLGLTWLSNNSFFDSRSRRYFACFLSAGDCLPTRRAVCCLDLCFVLTRIIFGFLFVLVRSLLF